tara:strand:- start:194 stop:403 length:210 start_codon:yes stop_codon:yes gene_type:complete
MNNPMEKKRQTYLAFFKDGVADGLVDGVIDDKKRSSAYYKQGYDFGLTMWNRILENGNGKESQDNGKYT